MRHALFVGVLATLATGSAGLLAEQSASDQASRVDVLLTTSPALSAMARASMMDEATTLWRRHGVEIEWLAPTAVLPEASNRLRALVVQKRPRATRATEPIAVGELVRPSTGHPLAFVSIEGARYLVASAHGNSGGELPALGERRLGIVLGRALAHEIGHYILDTRTHARSGLMRPSFDALEFTDLRDGTFALDRAAATWLRAREAGKFAY